VVVFAPEELRLKRVLQRDPQRNRQQVMNIIASQLSEGEKRKRADYVIVNDETQLVIPQVLKLHELFLTM
jgi:dephospho-CoA kinase